MSKVIEIPEELLLKSISTRTLIETALGRIDKEPAPHFEDGTAIPAIGLQWPGQGGVYAGMARSRDGTPDYHLIVAEQENPAGEWKPALKWATDLEADGHKDFSLPWRIEQAILFGNVPELFQKEYYWSRERHAEYGGSAWCQSFYFGYQYYLIHDFSLRARAVRRLVI